MTLTALFVRRPTLVTVLISLVLLAGTISAFTLVKQQYPNYDVPTIEVLVTYTGASTSELRDAIVLPLEDQIAGAPDLDSIETAIQPGQATIVVRFALNSDVNSDLVQTQGRVNNAQRQLPTDLQAPTVSIYDPSQAVVVSLVASSTTMEQGALSSLVTNKIVPSLEQVKGVSFVESNGAVTPSIQVNIHPNKLSASGFTLNDVTTAIANNNVRAPGGIAYGADRETNIDIRGDVTTPASVAGLLLSGTSTATTTDGASAFGQSQQLFNIGNVASVKSAYEPQRVYAFTQGRPSIALDVQKASNTSEVDASTAVLAELPALQSAYPNVRFDVLNVQSTYTKEQLSGVVRTLVEGIVFTGLVMLFFLRSWRNAVVVMVAIPTSLLVTLAAMHLANFTLDTVSLLAMTLIIGILVDDSIVVLENIERHYASGEDPQDAAIRGRTEIGVAAIVITLVDVVVFLPISFLPGTVGLFLREFGLVVTVATLTSLFVSFTITPSLAGRWSLLSTWRPWWLIDRFTAGFERVRDWYAHRALGWALRNQTLVLGCSLLAVVFAFALVPLGIVGFEYIPPVQRGEVYITATYPNGTPLATTRTGILAIERIVDASSVVSAETALAGAYVGNLPGYVQDGTIGQVHVFLKPSALADTQSWSDDILSRARAAVPAAQIVAIPATDTSGGIAQPIDEVITATGTRDPDTYAPQVADAMRRAAGATNVTTTSTGVSPQVDIEFDRNKARALDVSIGTASTAVRAAFGGVIATQFTGANGLEDVQVIYPERDQTDLAAIGAIPIRANGGGIVHVGDVARIVNSPAPPLIARINRRSVVYVGANVVGQTALSNVQNAFNRNVAALHLPSDIVVAPVTGGNQQNVSDTILGMSVSLVLSIALVYLLMVALYDSYRTPFVIMFSVPVAVVGALGALALTHQTLNLFSFIGSVLLVGLVSKNGILLVDFANRLRANGMDAIDAVRESALERFRPIVMTTLAMIAGMLPLALALDPGSEAERSLGTVVIGGLTSSLFLTLLIVPIVYLRFAPRSRGSRARGGQQQMPHPLERPADARV